MTVLGVTDRNEHVTLFEAAVEIGSLSLHGGSATERVSITANYMLVGHKHYDDGPHISRLRFSSALIEHVLRLWASGDFTDIRHRPGGTMPHVSPKPVASYADLKRRVRFRLFQPRVPTTTIEPMSSVLVDFLGGTTPKQAMSMLHSLRSLFALICGDVIDLWGVELHAKAGRYIASSDVYFYDPVPRPTSSTGFPAVPILNISKDRALFRRVMAGWLTEPDRRRTARGIFNAILQDKGILRPSHLRDLVTIAEMLADSDGTAPLTTQKFRALREALIATLDKFATGHADALDWRDTVKGRLDNLNYRDTRIILQRLIDALPESFVALPEAFAGDVVKLRNALVHDVGRLKPDDYNKMSFFVAKLKGLYALNDALALGGRPDQIIPYSQFLRRAELATTNVFGDESEDGAEG